MHQSFWRSRLFFPLTLLTLAGLPVAAQVPPPPPLYDAAPTRYGACQPPNPGEYLLLVVTETPDTQERVRQTLPPNASSTVCSYLENTVTRVGGFRSAENANAWARYMTETLGLSAVVAKPIATSQPSANPPQATVPPQSNAPRTPPPAYNPQPLGAGYAVLVDFFSRPELAAEIQQLLGREVGLAAYRQRPYLLAAYTSNQTTANMALKALTDRGYWAMVVDSRRVTLLRQTVASR